MPERSSPTTRLELERDLDDLLSRAFNNGIRVDNGGYALRHEDPDLPDWEVVITRASKRTGGDESSTIGDEQFRD